MTDFEEAEFWEALGRLYNETLALREATQALVRAAEARDRQLEAHDRQLEAPSEACRSQVAVNQSNGLT